jgi:hypothetical protein
MPFTNQPPQPIRTDSSNAFAHHTMSIRVPGIIRDVSSRNADYPPAIHDALELLAAELETDDLIPRLTLPTPDYEDWLAQIQPHEGETWLNSAWFFAEVFLYRLIMQAVRWWETGRDPFLPWKAEEVAGDALWMAMDAALSTRSAPPEERLAELLLHALWGNRIDLSLEIAASHGTSWHQDDLLADMRADVIHHLLQNMGQQPSNVHLITDNTGSELAMDLILAHALLETGAAARVLLHVKLHPTFVSDATAHDVLSFVRLLEHDGRTSDLRQFGASLREMFERRQLVIAPDAYWNSSYFLWDLPPRLRQTFTGGRLAILKGDANYRRAVGDAIWTPATPFSDVTAYFPIPLLALRTVKSDPVVGVPVSVYDRLTAEDQQWRVTGRRGLIQFNSAGAGIER